MLLHHRIPVSYILNKVKRDLAYVAVLALGIFLLTNTYQKTLPEMPLTIPAFIGTAISILLSFKLNQSYDRWWEARKIWGCIVNDSRSFVIQLQTLVKDGNGATVKKMAYRQIAWCYALGRSLRGLDPMEGAAAFLSPEDAAGMKAHSNKPLALLQQQGLDIKTLQKEGQVELFSQIQLDDTLLRFCDSQGRAERIKSTIFPVTYRLFLHFIIYLFIATLSISLKDVSWYLETPLLLLVSTAFFLLEKSATLMQDPFENKPTDTAMTAIARTIEINIRQLLNEPDVPEPVKPKEFYIL